MCQHGFYLHASVGLGLGCVGLIFWVASPYQKGKGKNPHMGNIKDWDCLDTVKLERQLNAN
jgi:hypothetical protein